MIQEEARILNETIKKNFPQIYEMLSEQGKKAFFPKKGILEQSAEAKETKINATIGQAFEENKKAMILESFKEQTKLSAEETFLYSPSYGQKELRKLWLEDIKKKNPSLKTKTSNPIVTNGITQGIHIVKELFAEKEDILVIPDFFWENYSQIFSEMQIKTYPFFSNKKFNIQGMKELLLEEKEKKKILILNFPNNPTGYSITKEEAEEIKKTIKETAGEGNKIITLCDDAYFGLFYEEETFKESIFSKIADIHENVLSIKTDGLTKEAYAWGLRIGFITFSFKGINEETAKALEDKTAGIIRKTTSNSCTHSQFLAINALKNENFEKQKKEKYLELKERYETTKKTLENNPEYKEHFEAMPFNSGYFMCIKLKNKNSEDVRKKLIKEHSIGTIEINNMLRIAYSAISKKEIPFIFEKIYEICREK
jgi:aspartate/methionine/tyrosine aminotransferase